MLNVIISGTSRLSLYQRGGLFGARTLLVKKTTPGPFVTGSLYINETVIESGSLSRNCLTMVNESRMIVMLLLILAGKTKSSAPCKRGI